jgi:hypothetical protein
MILWLEEGRKALRRVVITAGVLAAIVIVALLGRLGWQGWVGGGVAAAYSAKVFCSCVFVSQRDAASCRSEELSFFPFVETEIDRDSRTVVATAFWIRHARAGFQDGLGCTLH